MRRTLAAVDLRLCLRLIQKTSSVCFRQRENRSGQPLNEGSDRPSGHGRIIVGILGRHRTRPVRVRTTVAVRCLVVNRRHTGLRRELPTGCGMRPAVGCPASSSVSTHSSSNGCPDLGRMVNWSQSRIIGRGRALDRPYASSEKVNSKVLDFVQFGGPSCTELRTFEWSFALHARNSRGDEPPLTQASRDSAETF